MKHKGISFFVLEKLYRNRVGAKHISLDLRTGCPSHERGNIEKNLKKLKENLVLQHPTSYGMQYALNSQRLPDIMKILGIDLD